MALLAALKNENLYLYEALSLIKAKANLNIQDETGSTALIIACWNKSIEVALTLIAAKADLNIQNNRKNTALIYACYKQSTELPLALISAGADLNVQNNAENTALIIACWNGSTKIALALISAGANLNLQDNEEFTALTYACENELTEVTLALAKSDNLIYIPQYVELNNAGVQKALSFNFSQYPIRYEFTLADIHLLNSRNFDRILMLMLIRNQPNNYLHILPMELMELLIINMFS